MNNEPEPPEIEITGQMTLRLRVCEELADGFQQSCRNHPSKPTAPEIFLAMVVMQRSFIAATKMPVQEMMALEAFAELSRQRAEAMQSEQLEKN